MSEEHRTRLDAVATEWDACTRCSLHRSRTRTVHWRGTPGAKLLVVGEAPGADEDRTGQPFVGPAGKVLDRLMAKAGVPEYVVVNAVACRPPGNRKPTREELEACEPRLRALADAAQAEGVLAAGVTARTAVYSLVTRVKRTRATHHPARLLREAPDRVARMAAEFVQATREAAGLWGRPRLRLIEEPRPPGRTP